MGATDKEVLTGSENYFQWAKFMKYHLIGKDLWDSEAKKPYATAAKSDKAKAKMFKFVSSAYYQTTDDAATAAAAWDAIRDECVQVVASAVLQLRSQLSNLRQKPGQSISDYFIEAEKLRERLGQLGLR